MKKSILIITFLSFIISNKASAQTATTLMIKDTRDINELPNSSVNSIKADFKTRSILGVPGSGYWSANLTFSPWTNSDNTGGKNYQLNLNEGGLFYRNAYPLDPQWGNWQQILMTDSNGNLGIGTTNPNSNLTIRSKGTGVSIHSGSNPYFGTLAFNRESATGEIFDINGQAFQINNGGTDKNLHFQVYNGNGTMVTNDALVINGTNGNIGIGTTNITSELTVAGNIASREVKVSVDAGADFVFENDYNLPSLESLDKFIKENKHLPEIASAQQMQKDGINLSEMNIKLLQKIEELTLYSIEQNKKIEAQTKEIETFKDLALRVAKLEHELNTK